MPDIFISTHNNKAEDNKSKLQIKKIDFHGAKPSHVVSDDNHSHALASFCENPQGFSFQTQKRDEVILLFLRRHFITNLPWILIAIILSLIPIAFIALIPRFTLLTAIQIPRQLATIIILFYYLILFSYVFINFITWFYNVFLVTNERIVDIDYSHIVVHNIAETKVGQIEDVNYTQAGFIRTLLNFGDVFVQTAGTEMIFEALAVPKPREVTKIIANLIAKEAHAS